MLIDRQVRQNRSALVARQGVVQCVAVEEVRGVAVEVLQEAGEDSVTVVVVEVVGAAEVEAADSVLAGAVVEDEVEIPISLNRAVSEGVGRRPYIGRSGALLGMLAVTIVQKSTFTRSACKVRIP